MEKAKAVQAETQDRALELVLLPTKLSVGLTKVIANWHLDMSNEHVEHLVSLRIWSDLVSAHGNDEAQQQLTGPVMAEARMHKMEHLLSGVRRRITGEWEMPIVSVKPIARARAVMVLPIARFRIVAAGMAPSRATFVIGLPPEGNDERLRPIRLDQGPKLYTELAARRIA